MTNHGSPQREAQKPSAFLSGPEPASNPVRFYEFDRFRIDTKRHLLMRDGGPIGIKAKALDTLVLLVQHAGRLLEKEELMNGLWPDTAVEEGNLTQNIFEVRKALGEAPGEQRFIATVARRGYRFVAEVRAIGDEPSARDEGSAGDGQSTLRLVAPERFARRTVIYAGVAAAIVLSLVGTRLYVAFGRSAPVISGTSSSPLRNLTRLTYGAGLQTDVSWSPDGKRVAYAWNRDGNFDIWVQDVDAGQPTRVTSSPADETQPAWSPDGQRLALRSEVDGGGLFAVDVKGGPLRRIAPDGRRPAWMPNGREVMFVDSDMPRAAFIVTADGGAAPRRILETELSRATYIAPAVHPEGRLSVFAPKLATGFFVADRTNRTLNAVDTSAAAPLGLLDPEAIQSISWNSAGTALIVEAHSDGVPTLWRVAVEPVSLRWRTPERLTTAPASAQAAAVSPDGTRVAFTSAPASTRAWLFPFDANRARLTGDGRALTDDELSIVSLRLAADGSALCYGALEPGRNNFRLFHIDLTSGRTTFLAESWGGAISRTARTIAYLLTRTGSSSTGETPSTGRESALAVRDLDGGERLVSRWRGGLLPWDWAPHDEAVLGSWVEQGQMNQNVLAIWPVGPMMATRPERVLLEASGVFFWQARYSPDDRWVSFVAQRMRNHGTVEIGIVAADSNRATTWTRILDDHVWPDKPRWSPDGRTLYFLSRGADGYVNLWGVPIDPARGAQRGKPFQVTHFNSPERRIDPNMGSAEIDVASGRLALPMQSVKGSIWLLSGVRP
ncbi:winged helix-turn-helix domain-containing protein [Luteitalea pratensis]|uniref:winged helix-turn-helix domain-containing protein n=1 Tax=Luteitalea pratensis TaxID=1855912 RepID=UPI0012FFC327|nr:winged helix-turn-helix domain-containing protein [Luteitalea pratensis]